MTESISELNGSGELSNYRDGGIASYDVVIVGAGIAGSVFARELSGLGLRILVLEKGAHYQNHLKEFKENELDMWNRVWPSRQYEVEGNAFTGAPNFGFGVGGGSLVWTNVCLRFHRHDFRMKSTYGMVHGAALEDWPFSYEDIETYYQNAEDQLGVAGAPSVWHDQRQQEFPFPPFDAYPSSAVLQEGMAKSGLRSGPGPVAVASLTRGQRNTCLHCGFCRSSCRIDAKFQADSAVFKPLLQSRQVELVSQAEVIRLIQDRHHSLVNGLEYVDLKDGRRRKIRGRLFFVCNNPIETPRLFLNSASAFSPSGLGNRRNLVGRHLFGHIGTVGAGISDRCLNTSIGYNMGNVISLDHVQSSGSDSHVGGFVLESLQGSGAGVLAVDPYRDLWGAQLKDAMRKYNNGIYMVSFGETMPVYGNRVSLSKSLKDAHGMPQARIEYSWHENDLAVDRHARDVMTNVFRSAGISSVHFNPTPFEAHLQGTMRMGTDPGQSVTDPWGKVHGLDNVYVGGASLYVTGSSVNPTLTLYALALRTAAHVRNRFGLRR
ncbi:MAG: GMC family oxidoreductase [Lautropia sp.]|nr:GMC family oxidoreductase [Lautropia sp.]